MIVILNKIEVITTYGKLLYEAINKKVVMKKIVDRYTNNIFENIKHMDEYENEYWYARELSKVLEYKDWRNFLKVLNKAKDVHYEVGKKVRKAIADIGGTMPEEMPTPKKSLKELERERKKLEIKEQKKLDEIK